MREETEAQQGGAGAAPAAPAVRSRAASLPRRGEKAPGARVESQPVTLPLDSSSIPGASGCARRGARRALGQSRSGGSELCQLW